MSRYSRKYTFSNGLMPCFDHPSVFTKICKIVGCRRECSSKVIVEPEYTNTGLRALGVLRVRNLNRCPSCGSENLDDQTVCGVCGSFLPNEKISGGNIGPLDATGTPLRSRPNVRRLVLTMAGILAGVGVIMAGGTLFLMGWNGPRGNLVCGMGRYGPICATSAEGLMVVGVIVVLFGLVWLVTVGQLILRISE